jgi:hypothetical protein
MQVKAKKDEILQKLYVNRESHTQIVSEARIGYVEEARKALERRLDDLKSGKIINLSFALQAPQDYTDIYNTAIKMLELHQEEYIILNAVQIRNLIMDEWDWKRDFLISNARYSKTASSFLEK